MIVEFTCRNFRSFKDETTLSMVAVPRLKEEPDEGRVLQLPNELGLLSSAGIFGLNAGGKTNLLKAVRVAVDVISNKNQAGPAGPGHPTLETFQFDKESASQPTAMELVLWDKNNQSEYICGFEVDSEKILREWFYVSNKEKLRFTKKKIFDRKGDEFEFGPSVSSSTKKLKEHVRPDRSAVSVLSQFNHPESKQVLELLEPPMMNIFNIDSSHLALSYAIDKHGQVDPNKLNENIRRADLGIENIDIREEDIHPANIKLGTKSFFPLITQNKSGISFSMHKVLTKHHQYNNGKRVGIVEMSLADNESKGTNMFVGLITATLEALESGGVLLIDELGSSMHPFLTKMIVDQFDNRKTNPNSAQLIYNSHETYLLGQETNLRRDQIWLADKNEFGQSYLKRMSEYRTRKDYDIAKNYLGGRFGAIPFVDESS